MTLARNLLCVLAMKAGNKPATRAKLLLVLGDGASESEAFLAGLQGRGGFQLVRASTAEIAEVVLRDFPVSLALACAQTPADEIERLVAAMERTRHAVPVLAIRHAHSGEAERWAQLGVGILRSPLLPDALVRSVEVVLDLKRKV